MLKSVSLKFTDSPDVVLPGPGITVFVGPNNSGKSLVLRELEDLLETGNHNVARNIVSAFELNWPTVAEAEGLIDKFAVPRGAELADGRILVGRLRPGKGPERAKVRKEDVFQIVTGQTETEWFVSHLLRWGVLRLDGRSRFELTDDKDGGDLLQAPTNTLVHLFQNDALRQEVRNVVFDAFGQYFVLDPTRSGQIRIRLSRTPPLDDEQSLNAAARAFHAAALHIREASDGVQAFTGIATAVFSGEYHTLLIDEPEAFLHPPLARKLGKHLARRAQSQKGALLASTHSADFLMGCIEATANVRIVRLDYRDGTSRGRLVDTDQLEALFKTPLMRSANVISALFHDGVVVTESDNDRAFYAEVYYRLAQESDLPAVLFVNAQNKQTIKDILGPLRAFGVPAVAIPDIDVLKDGGTVWSDWLKAVRVPQAMRLSLGQQRATLKGLFETAGKDMKRDGGVTALAGSDVAAANHFFDMLAEYGLFAVRRGEVEQWLPALEIPGKKTDWTIAMLERLGSDPSSEDYVRPADGDVWDFMRAIVAWISDSSRKGME